MFLEFFILFYSFEIMKKIKKQFLLLIFTDLSLQQIILNLNVLPNRQSFLRGIQEISLSWFLFLSLFKKSYKEATKATFKKTSRNHTTELWTAAKVILECWRRATFDFTKL